eukprot:TRINITY_DN27511_c0_g2_i2.p1 TRINITY_DN27511_c0_g2~~TRINITY_DN27511_c0_g2_i2.p1  ORF type:complete len:384 (+),score=58.42 TRINITY_DN27511_c0_g2_i2:84-1235(+)
MGSSTSLGIKVTSQTTTDEGVSIEGIVCMKAKEDVDATHIQIAFLGVERTRVKYKQRVGHGDKKRNVTKYAREKKEFFRLRWNLVEFPDGKCAAGEYEYPFKFTAPTAGLPSTFYEKMYGIRGSWCKVGYAIEARLHKTGWLKWNNVALKGIQISSKCPSAKEIKPVMQEREVDVRFCCCLKQGTMKLAASVNKDSFCSGEELEILYEASNPTSVEVNNITITLEEYVFWKARNKREHRIIRQVDTLPATKLNTGERAIALEEDPHKMIVKPHFRDTFRGSLITCTHCIKVKLNTGWGTTNPQVGVNVHIYDKNAGEDPDAAGEDNDNDEVEDDEGEDEPEEVGASEAPAGWSPAVAVMVNLDDVAIVDKLDPDIPMAKIVEE